MTDAAPDVVRTGEPVDADEVFITLPTRNGENEVQISRQPIYDALSQLSFTLCNGDGWASGMPTIAWQRLRDGVDPYESYTYSTYEEVLVDLYAVAAQCIPNGWWPVQIYDHARGLEKNLEAWTLDAWNDHQREHGYTTIDDPAAALDALAEEIRTDPRATAEYERKRAADALPAGIPAIPTLMRPQS